MKKEFIFVFQKNNGEIGAASKRDIDKSIRSYEDANVDLDFKTIGKIETPMSLDFPATAIEWYIPKDELTQEIVSHSILSIINELKHGQTNYAGKDF